MRSIALLAAGAIVGGASVYLFQPRSFEPVDDLRAPAAAEPPGTPPATSPALGTAAELTDSSQLATRIATFERALTANDAIDLEAMLDVAVTASRSRSRDLEIRALLGRLAELDPAGAVDYAQSAYLDTPFLVQAFEALAGADPAEAVARLGSVRPSSKQRRVALALLDVLGADAEAVQRIASALPEGEQASFALDVLIARAELDPLGVLHEALAGRPPGMRSYLLPRLAELAAAHDPLGALALADEFTDLTLVRTYEYALIRAWADLDSDAVFAWLEAADAADISSAAAAFSTLAQSDPDRLLAMVETFPPAARTSAQRAIAQTLAERDPISALALIDTLPPGQDRESLLQTIAQTYGRQDPETALAWAKSLSPPSQAAVQAVLLGIASVDADRAIDLFIAEISEQGAMGPGIPGNVTIPSFGFFTMLPVLTAGDANVGRLTDRLLETNDPRMRSMLSSVISSWASRDATAALGWTMANADRLDAGALRGVARNLAQQNMDLAVSSLERLPPAQRAGWIEGVASAMAQTNVDQARGFLDRFRGQPGYDAAIGTVAGEMARADPAGAARLLADLESPVALQRSALTIGRQWANQDPASAARWAIDEVADPQVRNSVLSTIASSWVQRDAAAAEQWLMSLSSGPNRDAAADGLLSAAAQVGRFEPRLLEAYSSEQASQQGVSRAIVAMARSNPSRAEELMNTYLTDPALRAQTEERIAQVLSAGSGLAQGIFIGL